MKRALGFLAANRIFVALAVEVIVLAVFADNFFTRSNLVNVINQNAAIAIVAVGMTYVILTAGIDLSVGATLGLAGVVCTAILKANGGMLLAIGGGVATGALVGAVNGLVITRLKVSPFITTLAMLWVVRGAAYQYTQARTISDLPTSFEWIGGGRLFDAIPVPILIMLLVFAGAMIVLTKTTYGRYLYAIGGNREAARLSGIRVERTLLATYLVCGVLAALAGIVMASRLGAGDPKLGEYYELDAVTAVVVGGTSLFGGRGSLWGTLLGALFIGLLLNGMVMLDVGSYMQLVIKGSVLLTAAALDRKGL